MTGRLPDPDIADRRAALRAFWAERRALARDAMAGLDFTGAVHPPRAAAERDWLLRQPRADGGRAARESDEVLEMPPAARRRTR